MTRFKFFLAAVLILLSAGWTLASTIQAGDDPRIIINGGQTTAPTFGISDPEFPITGMNFEFDSPTGTSPATSPCVINGVNDPNCNFTNESDVRWSTLTFRITPSGQKPPFECEPNAFFSVCYFNAAGTQVTFSTAGSARGGIGVGETFQMLVVGWEPDSGFAGRANKPGVVPEPGTLALVALGLGIVARRGKRRRNLC